MSARTILNPPKNNVISPYQLTITNVADPLLTNVLTTADDGQLYVNGAPISGGGGGQTEAPYFIIGTSPNLVELTCPAVDVLRIPNLNTTNGITADGNISALGIESTTTTIGITGTSVELSCATNGVLSAANEVIATETYVSTNFIPSGGEIVNPSISLTSYAAIPAKSMGYTVYNNVPAAFNMTFAGTTANVQYLAFAINVAGVYSITCQATKSQLSAPFSYYHSRIVYSVNGGTTITNFNTNNSIYGVLNPTINTVIYESITVTCVFETPDIDLTNFAVYFKINLYGGTTTETVSFADGYTCSMTKIA